MTAIIIDCTELYQNPIRTGIQRVVRELLRHWPHDRTPARVARFDAANGLVALPEPAIRILSEQEPGVANMARDGLVSALGKSRNARLRGWKSDGLGRDYGGSR
jgi:hypothetical protein